jgi:sterol desaturase/sphingolipid hydroxylase (fatty acid hydroxylase superfamily)
MRKTSTALCSKMLTLLMALAPLLLLLLLGLEVSQRLWRLLVQLAGPMSFGGAMCRSTIVGGVGFLFVVLPLVVIEHLFPASRLSMRSYAIGMAGWPIAWALSYVVGIAEQALIGRLSVTPLLVVHGNAHRTGVAIALIFVSMFVFDFFYYWFHRMQHSIPALWRLHAVHHSIRELNAVMSFHHPLEALLRIIPVTLPLALLVRFDDMPVIPIVSAFVGCWGQFIHTDTRISLGQGAFSLPTITFIASTTPNARNITTRISPHTSHFGIVSSEPCTCRYAANTPQWV